MTERNQLRQRRAFGTIPEDNKVDSRLSSIEAANRLRQLRLSASLSFRALADRLPVERNASYLCRVESGRIPISGAVIDKYIYGTVEDKEQIEKIRDEIRLLAGHSPVDTTPEEAQFLAEARYNFRHGNKN